MAHPAGIEPTANPQEGFVHTGEAHIMVPGYPFEIYDFANGSGSYIHLTLFVYKK